jgi:zinc protease
MYSYAYYGGFLGRNHSAYTTYASAKEGKLMESLELVMLENRRLQQHGFLQSELDRAKDELLESYDRSAKEESKTNSSSFADRLVYYFLENEPMPSADKKNEWAKALMEDITLEEVNALISKWITEENFVCTITMPEKKGIKVPTEENVLKLIEKCKKASTKPWVDNVKTEPFLAQEPKGGKVVSQTKNEKFDYTEYTLSNGAKVILKKTNHQNDQILTRAESKGGNSLYEDKDIMNVDYASSIVNSSGIGTYDNTQLMKFMKGKSFGLYSYISDIKEVIDGGCAPKDFETQLQYFYLVFTAPRIDKEVLASEVDKLKSQISMMKNDPVSIWAEKQLKAMYPNDKRNIYIPTDAQIKELNTDKMLKIFKERFSDASDFTFTFVGNIDEKTMLPLIEKYIGGLPSSNGKNAEMWKDRSATFAKGIVDEAVYAGEAEKGKTTIVFQHEFDYNNDRLVTDALSEVCYNKLFETIREELSGTYSPSFYLGYSKYPKAKLSAFYDLDCNPNTIDQLTQATFKVFDKIISEGISEEDLIKAKETLILNRKKSEESNYFWLRQILGSKFDGYEMQTLEEYTAAVNALTAEDIKKVAEKYLKHDEYVRVSLKPAAMKPTK